MLGVLLLLTVLLPTTLQQADYTGASFGHSGCEMGWFGKGCQYKCHCHDDVECGTDGSCSPGVKCTLGYFGPACQYLNLAYTDHLPGTSPFLWDSDASTCNTERGTTFLVFGLIKPVPFHWVRLVFKEEGDHSQLTFRVNKGKYCIDERRFIITSTIIDITCNTPTQLKSFSLNGLTVESLCEVYISGGRNLALKQKIYSSSSWNTTTGSEQAVDGQILENNVDAKCAMTNDNHPSPHLEVDFQANQIVSRIVMFYTPESMTPCRMNWFTVQLLDAANNTLFSFEEIETKRNRIMDVSLPHIMPVRMLQTFIPDSVNSPCKTLSVCEIEVYGETMCPDNTYGLSCEHRCDCNPEDVCHVATGACALACNSGFYGNNCSQKCGSKCLDGSCYQRFGSCVHCKPGYRGAYCKQVCEHGFFGVDCASNCSRRCVEACDIYRGECVSCALGFLGTHCEDCAVHYYGDDCSGKCSPHCIDICNIKTGECTCKTGFYGSLCNECGAGWFGPNCTNRCPSGCKGRLCHVETGQCSGCLGRYTGPLCDECPDKYYGYMCKYECSRMCLNESCDPLTGTCAECLNSYDGPQCLIAPEEGKPNLWFLAPMIVSLSFLTLMAIHLIRKKLETAQSEEHSLSSGSNKSSERSTSV